MRYALKPKKQFSVVSTTQQNKIDGSSVVYEINTWFGLRERKNENVVEKCVNNMLACNIACTYCKFYIVMAFFRRIFISTRGTPVFRGIPLVEHRVKGYDGALEVLLRACSLLLTSLSSRIPF